MGWYVVRCRWCGQLWQSEKKDESLAWQSKGCPHCQGRERIRANAILVRSFSETEWEALFVA